ncbi:MAG: metallophosphoesterase [Rikenellaceae bacterium]
MAQNVTFGIITDIHTDIIHDGLHRLNTFLEVANKNKVDFVIDLGDFAMVKEDNKPFVDIWKNYTGEKYNTLGNHDMDNATKEQFMDFVGMKERYYSFIKNDVLFIVLDCNNLYHEGKYTHYANANFYVDASCRAWVDPQQVEWLKKEIQKDAKHCIIFSHQSLENTVGNREQIQAILEAENQRVGYAKIVASFSGHDHTDYHKMINGIAYIQINSASDQWLGEQYKCTTRFTVEDTKRRPLLSLVAPYKDPLYAIVKMGKKSLKIKGVQSEFVSPTPEELGIPKDLYSIPLTAKISDLTIKF